MPHPDPKIEKLIESLDIPDSAEREQWADLADHLLKGQRPNAQRAFCELYQITNGNISNQEWQKDQTISLGLSILLSPLTQLHNSPFQSETFYRLQNFVSKKLVQSKERFREEVDKMVSDEIERTGQSRIAKQHGNKYFEEKAAPEIGTLRILFSPLAYQLAQPYYLDSPNQKSSDKFTELVSYQLENSLINAKLLPDGAVAIPALFRTAVELRSRHSNNNNNYSHLSLDREGFSLLDIFAATPAEERDTEIENLIQYVLSHVNEKYRIPLLMHEVEDMKYEDIAEKLKRPLGTIKSQIFQARKTLEEIGKQIERNEYGEFIIPTNGKLKNLKEKPLSKEELAEKLNKLAAEKEMQIHSPGSWSQWLDEAAKEKGISHILWRT